MLQVLYSTGYHGNTEAVPDLIAGRYVRKIFLEKDIYELRPERQVRVR